jgi:hypothetical protein
MSKALSHLKSDRDYGVLSDVSKTMNYALGDRTGRSISMRTAQGFKMAFDFNEMHEDTAEDIVHAGMVATGFLLKSDNDNANACGFLLLLGLVACYQNGR